MAELFITGSNGSCTIGGTNHTINFNTWSATFSRSVHDVTAFGDTGRRRILGVADVQGSAGGFLSSNVANTAPSVFTNMHAMGDVDGIVVLTSTPADSTDPTVASHTFNAIVSDIALSSTMGGDATGTFNFQLAGGTDTQGVATGGTAMEAWDESV